MKTRGKSRKRQRLVITITHIQFKVHILRQRTFLMNSSHDSESEDEFNFQREGPSKSTRSRPKYNSRKPNHKIIKVTLKGMVTNQKISQEEKVRQMNQMLIHKRSSRRILSIGDSQLTKSTLTKCPELTM